MCVDTSSDITDVEYPCFLNLLFKSFLFFFQKLSLRLKVVFLKLFFKSCFSKVVV